MDKAALLKALSSTLSPVLADELVSEFLAIRRDVATRTLGRSSLGKFVETFVQCLQWMATGAYEAKPSVDKFLTQKAETLTTIPEGLRVCAPRAARVIYTLRNKRNIAHKNPVDTNSHDLATAYQNAVWVISELLRESAGISMQEAGRLISQIQAPIGTLVEEIDGTRLVHATTSTKNEILILLHSVYPNRLRVDDFESSIVCAGRKSIVSRVGEMVRSKLIHGNREDGYKLTTAGYEKACTVLNELIRD